MSNVHVQRLLCGLVFLTSKPELYIPTKNTTIDPITSYSIYTSLSYDTYDDTFDNGAC
uniref:Uncharacterized protein n=1 Tax=Anguilla anguilla TaxID=7936 RepID=A0A0E9RG42_ANGAN